MDKIKLRIILTTINDIDTNLFLLLNGIHSPLFDIIFSWVTNKFFWIPLYLFLFFITALKFRWKTIYIFLFVGALIVFADQVSVHLFKNIFERLRPCHNPDLANIIHIVDGHCGGRFGFVSSHATNSFSLAFFIGFLFKKHYRLVLLFMLFWAALVSYSRIYVGVHYPGDVLVGAILGSSIGIVVFWLMKVTNRQFNLKIEIER